MLKALRSRRAITLIVAVAFALAAYFGVVLPADLQMQIIEFVAAMLSS